MIMGVFPSGELKSILLAIALFALSFRSIGPAVSADAKDLVIWSIQSI